jgi:hypothetical protein
MSGSLEHEMRIKAMHATMERHNPRLKILETGTLFLGAQVPEQSNVSLRRY